MLFVLLLPLFLLTGLGCLLVKSRWLGVGWSTGVNELTAKLLIPALLLNGAYKNGIPAAVSWQVLGAFYLPLIVLFALIAYGYKRDVNSAARALAATYSNTAFVGIPVLVQAFGSASLQYAFPIIAFHGLVAFTMYYLAVPGAGSGHRRLLNAVGNAARNPIVVSLFLGLALNLLGVSLPSTVQQVLSMLATAALPCALLALGASLARFRLVKIRDALFVVATKLLVLPACVLVMAVYVFHFPAAIASVLVVMASCPVAVNAGVVVAADGEDPALSSAAILLSSLACMATIPLWLMIVRQL